MLQRPDMDPVHPVLVAVARGLGSCRGVGQVRVAGQEHRARECSRVRGALHLLLADEEPRDVGRDGGAADERDRRQYEDHERLTALVRYSTGSEGRRVPAGARRTLPHQKVGFSVMTVVSARPTTGRTPSPRRMAASGDDSSRSYETSTPRMSGVAPF